MFPKCKRAMLLHIGKAAAFLYIFNFSYPTQRNTCQRTYTIPYQHAIVYFFGAGTIFYTKAHIRRGYLRQIMRAGKKIPDDRRPGLDKGFFLQHKYFHNTSYCFLWKRSKATSP